MHRGNASDMPERRRAEADDKPDSQRHGENRLNRGSYPAPHSERDNGRHRGRDDHDVAEAHPESGDMVLESEVERIASDQIADHHRQHLRVRPHYRSVGKAEEPRADVAVIVSERLLRV